LRQHGPRHHGRRRERLGKTTSIGKLAHNGCSCRDAAWLLAAGDTFRAAAREQLVALGRAQRRAGIAQQSGDPGAVVFDALGAAGRAARVVIATRPGGCRRSCTSLEEIRKVKRVAEKRGGAPHEVLLVLDANTGQNALAQGQGLR